MILLWHRQWSYNRIPWHYNYETKNKAHNNWHVTKITPPWPLNEVPKKINDGNYSSSHWPSFPSKLNRISTWPYTFSRRMVETGRENRCCLVGSWAQPFYKMVAITVNDVRWRCRFSTNHGSYWSVKGIFRENNYTTELAIYSGKSNNLSITIMSFIFFLSQILYGYRNYSIIVYLGFLYYKLPKFGWTMGELSVLTLC